MGRITAKAIARTAFLPGIVPRLKALTKNSFSTLAYLMALLYRSVNLLPPGHPLTLPANHGRYGLRDVIAAAADNLVISRKNIDQLIIFFTILLGLALLIAQTIVFFASIIMDTAWAGPATPTFGSLFETANPDRDIAFSMLDLIFAVPGIFGSEHDPAITGIVPPFNQALQDMFAFYSYAMLMVGVFIFAYYVLVVIFETASTGVPFGQRFDSVWAPLRLVLALLLLIPLGFGLNAGQYITLYAAKYGSGLATNSWNIFWATMVDETGASNATPFGYRSMDNEDVVIFRDDFSGAGTFNVSFNVTGDDMRYRRALIAAPKFQNVNHLTSFSAILWTCKAAYERAYGMDIQPYLVSKESSVSGEYDALPLTGTQYSGGPNYLAALDFFDKGDIVVRFGVRDVDKYEDEAGNVKPFCGEVAFKPLFKGDITAASWPPIKVYEMMVFEFGYYYVIMNQRAAPAPLDGGKKGLGEYIAARNIMAAPPANNSETICNNFNSGALPHPFGAGLQINSNLPCENLPSPDAQLVKEMNGYDNYSMALPLAAFYATILSTEEITIPDTVMERGWGGAAIWYNKIAQLNGSIVAAKNKTPSVSRMPLLMEQVLEEKQREEATPALEYKYRPYVVREGDEEEAVFAEDQEKQQIAEAMNETYLIFSQSLSAGGRENSNDIGMIFKIVNWLMGTEGIYTIRENIQVHPLAQLSTLGRSMLDAAMRNLSISAAAAAGGGILSLSSDLAGLGDAMSNASAFFSAFVASSLAMGIVLYYIIPFLPFMFFFFAIVSWVKTIFEAMIGVPLWALAHLRIQGNGLPGQAASSGYFLIFEIFIRPILIVFGLLAASIIFFTQVYLLHVVFDLVVANVGGSAESCANLSGAAVTSTNCDLTAVPGGESSIINDIRGQADAFFFTVMYTIIVYMMANSTFKLIDSIPSQILRWMGSATDTYADNAPDPTDNLIRNASIGGAFAGGQLSGAVPGVFGSIGRGVGSQV